MGKVALWLLKQAKKMKYIVAVDFSVIFHICYWPAVKAVQKDARYVLEDVVRTNLDGRIRTLERELRELQVDEYELVFVEDRYPQHKVNIFPQYHSDRPDNSQSKANLKQYALGNGFNCKFCHSEGNEADDAIATVVSMAKSHLDLFVIVCTGDHDLWQLLGEGVGIFDLLRRRIIREQDVLEKFSVLPQQIALVKALWGDSSDNVPNVMPFQRKQLLPIVQQTEDGSLTEFTKNVRNNWSKLSVKCRDLYSKREEQIAINYELVRLSSDCELTWG